MSKQTIEVDIAAEAIEIVRTEITTWEDAVCFVTDKVAFNMRNLIRQLRKNYWGIFDESFDPHTGRKKIWIPLSEYIAEATIKNFDMDTKDINFRAKNGQSVGFTSLIRNIVKNFLDRIFFGEHLDMSERNLAIDGTFVWKTLEDLDVETKKKTINIDKPDLLNIYIDPTAESIQKAFRFTEAALMLPAELQAMSGWDNTDELEGSANLNANEVSQSGQKMTANYIDVYEMWGKIPEYLITGIKKDKELVDGHIVVSGLKTPGKEKWHLIEKTETSIKPYEEAWYRKVAGRWYGKGPVESIMMLQLWVNIIVNIRITRSYVSQLGIFKIKKGSNITPQMVAKLAANGAIKVNSQDDIEQLVMQEASVASYKDEDAAVSWAQRVSSAFEAVTGETMPSSTPATNAAIQAAAGQSAFVLIKEGMGMFLQRWLKRQALPLIMKTLQPRDIVQMTGDPDEMRTIDEKIVNYLLYRRLDEMSANLQFLQNPAEIAAAKADLLAKLSLMGKDRYIELLHKLNPTDFDVEVYVTNEEFDKAVVTKDLVSILGVVPEYREQIVQQLFDIMGLDLKLKPAVAVVQPGKADVSGNVSLPEAVMPMRPGMEAAAAARTTAANSIGARI